MRVVIVGAGPAGLYSAIVLARRGHEVTVIDRDPGPGDPDWFSRRGVMQFHHPHFFREQVREALAAEMPEVWTALVEAGAVPVTTPGPRPDPAGFRCRRATFERHLRRAAEREPGVCLRVGHADRVLCARGRATGVQAGGREVPADLVMDASGRAGRLTRQLRGPAEGGDCGRAYVSRQYQLRPGAAEGSMNAPPGLIAWHRGYLTIAFPHEHRTLSVLIARPSSERRLERLRYPAVFDVAVAAIPSLAAWTDPSIATPISPVLPGGRLYNSYRGQTGPGGRITPGLIFLGDAVLHHQPGRRPRHYHLAAASQAAGHAARRARPRPRQLRAGLRRLVRTRHQTLVHRPRALGRRTDPPLGWRRHRPDQAAALGPHRRRRRDRTRAGSRRWTLPGMRALPANLHAAEPRARAVYATGWRPPVPPGPDLDELAELITAAGAASSAAASPRA